MSQPSVEDSVRSQTQSSVPYAIGILARDSPTEAIIRTGLEAKADGFDVYVSGYMLDRETELLLHRLDITVVDDLACDSFEDARELLIEAGRANAHDGMIITESAAPLDSELARTALQTSDGFAISRSGIDSGTRPANRLIGIPAYNESVGIGSTILAAQAYADEVVVIDDGSTDDTADIARRTGATVLEHGENKGKGRALNTFFDYARSTSHDTVVVLDGDGQHLPSDIPAVVEPVENGEADLVIGSRYLDGNGTGETPMHRRFGQRVLDFLTLGSSGAKLSDTQSGFRAFSPEAVERMTIRTDGMGVESEMISTAADHDLRIEEAPIDIRYEGVDGQTFNPLRHGLSVAAFVLMLVRDRHPLLFFGVPGLLFSVLGIGLGTNAVLLYNAQGAFPLGQTLLSMKLTVIGILGVFCGLILNRMSNMMSELQTEGV